MLQKKNDEGEIDNLFLQFSELGNLVMFKNQLAELVKKPVKKNKNTILGALQRSTHSNHIQLRNNKR